MSGIEFTPREMEVVRLAASGKGRTDIAALLGITSRTAAVHLRTIYAKVGISGRGAATRLTAWAIGQGYGDIEVLQ